MKSLSAAQRLVVAADFRPESGHDDATSRSMVRDKVLWLADQLNGSGVCLKLNSAIRAWGFGLADEVRSRGLDVFGDWKLNDIKETLVTDSSLMRRVGLRFITVMCSTGIDGLRAFKSELPNTNVLGVTVLTSLTERDAEAIYGFSIERSAKRLAEMGQSAGLDGFVASGKEATILRETFGDRPLIVTPAIRPASLLVAGDDQNPDRIMTPAKALKAGADVLVVGRPITQAANPLEATKRTLDEIDSAMH